MKYVHSIMYGFDTWLQGYKIDLNEFTRYCDECGKETYPRWTYGHGSYCRNCMCYYWQESYTPERADRGLGAGEGL